MRFTRNIVSVLATASLVLAQGVTVQVGGNSSTPGGIFQFMPNNVTAKEGDVVTFVFSGAPGNHSVTQSSFADPCTPLAGGFDSGWVTIPAAGVNPSPSWSLTVTNASKPLWFFCKQLAGPSGAHCIAGMVGAINAPATGNTIDSFVTAAKAFKGTPGQAVGALVGQGASASAPPGPLGSGATLVGTPAATPTAPASSGSGGGSPSQTKSGAGASNSASVKPNAAGKVVYNSFVLMVASVLGIALA